MVRQDFYFKIMPPFETESKKRLPTGQAGWPEKSARRGRLLRVEALIFLDLFCLGSDEMVTFRSSEK
jgi:hypothetical protein